MDVKERNVLMMTSEEAAQAACKGMDTNIFYSGMSGRYANELTAKAICVACPVRLQCLQQGLENEEYGIWGGTTELERKAMRKRQLRTARVVMPLFTPRAKEELDAQARAERKMSKLKESNERRAIAASNTLRTLLEEAKATHGAALPPAVITMVEWKIANPTMTYADIASLMTPRMTKDQAAGLIRRWIKGKK
jgi:WhiB family redox-sensing transcriptional regulator